MGVHIKSTRGVTLCNFAVTVSYKYFYSSKKIECFHPSLLNTSTCRLNHPRFIVVDLRALGNKLCKLWQNMIGSTDSKWKNGLIGSARTCVTNVMHFALLQDFDLSHWHPSGRRACLIFALQKIGMAFKGFTVSTAENCLSICSTVVALQKCFIRFRTSRSVIVMLCFLLQATYLYWLLYIYICPAGALKKFHVFFRYIIHNSDA